MFTDDAPIDLGTSAYLPKDWRPRRTQIQGKRSAQLRAQLRLLCPKQPGVYVMLNADDEIFYIGKAKNLRTRLMTYFRPKSRDPKAGRIVARARTILWEVLPSEFTALHRELELIRRWRPSANVQGQPLRRRHAYLCLGHRPAPYLSLTRRLPEHLAASFGPLPVTRNCREAVRRLNDLFRLRDCPPGPIALFPSPKSLFPMSPPAGCLRLEVGTCLGPCTLETTPEAYQVQVDAAKAFLEGRDLEPLRRLEVRMKEAAVAQQFERAAALRDQVAVIAWLIERLARLRKAQAELSFVYPVLAEDGRSIWYLLHGARVVDCVAAPTDAASAALARERIRAVYENPNAGSMIDAYEPIDGAALVLAWFRKHPRRAIVVDREAGQ